MDPNEYPRRKSGNLSMKWMDDTPLIFREQTWFVAYTWRQWRTLGVSGVALLRILEVVQSC